MELQIQDLVSSIRKDGIEAANAEAEAIISEAKKTKEQTNSLPILDNWIIDKKYHFKTGVKTCFSI